MNELFVGEPVKQDKERFKLLFTNSRPKMPEKFCAPFEMVPTLTLIRQRLESLGISQD